MTRVVVPRASTTPSSQQQQSRGSSSAGTSTSSTVPPPPPLPPPGALVPSSRNVFPKEESSEVETNSSSEAVEVVKNETEVNKVPSLHPGAAAGSSSVELAGSSSNGGEDDVKLGGGNGTGTGTQPEKQIDSGAATAIVVVPVPSCNEVAKAASSPATTSSCSAPLPSSGSSRRGGLSRTTVSIRRIPKSKTSPTGSRSNSPRSHHEEDGYNSADESSPWTSGPSSFADLGEREAHFESELRRVKGLELRRMAADGNCLFRAVADQVYGDQEMHADTRQMCIDYMERERDHFSQFVTEGFTAYCKRKRRDKVYGNNLEIQAMAEMYNRPIHIYSYSAEPINIFHGQYQTDLPPMRLSYHRGNHYNSLHDPSRPSVGAGLGFGSLRGANVDRDQIKAAILAQQNQQIDNALVAEGRYYSDLELTEQEIERMVMEASRAEFLAQERHRQEETSSSADGEPSSSGAASRSGAGGSQPVSYPVTDTLVMETAANKNSNVRMLLSMGFNYFRVMEASSIFGDDVNNMLCYLLETDSGESVYSRMKGKAAEK